MKTNKLIVSFGVTMVILLSIAATTKQLIGPTLSTTTGAVARWADTGAFRLTNSVVLIDDSGNVSGVNTQSMTQANVGTATTTNGFLYLLKSSGPAASDIGGTVGSITNYMIGNSNGALYAYWSDGTTKYSKKLAP